MTDEKAERLGQFLFRYRSAVPTITAVVLLPLAMIHYGYPRGSHRLDTLWEILCLVISLSGLAIRMVTAGYAPRGTSGRNTSGQKAEQLNTTGMYSLVRNPLYLGNYLIWLGISLFPRAWWCPIAVTILFAVTHKYIVFAESQFLRRKFGSEYDPWASRTPSFLPRLGPWKAPAIPFSPRTVLKREHTSFFSIMVAFTVLEFAGDLFYKHRLVVDWFWVVAFAISLVAYAVLRTLKKRTHILDVEGR